jgi:CheY-like chemotaxis protein
MNILLVEDDQFKARRLEQLLKLLRSDATIERANSVTASERALEFSSPLDLVVLDMSLPTFDVGPSESGGRPQGFGGREIMRFMANNDINVPVIVVTQFERFGEPGKETDLPTLSRSLESEFPGLFRGIVYYDAASERWREEVSSLLAAVVSAAGGTAK